MDMSTFVDIKLLKDDSLLVYERETSDLVKYNKYMSEVKRVEGVKKN